MSEFTYCLNTSTIRPTPLLEKVRIAGALGYRAIEPWNDEVTEYLAAGGTIADLRKARGVAVPRSPGAGPAGGRHPRDGVPRLRRRDQDGGGRPGRRRRLRRPALAGRRRRLPHDPRRRLGRRPAPDRRRPHVVLPHQRR